ncbi:hypothetical protein AAE478_006628 [Parahypoxylon ruwenzoriense]
MSEQQVPPEAQRETSMRSTPAQETTESTRSPEAVPSTTPAAEAAGPVNSPRETQSKTSAPLTAAPVGRSTGPTQPARPAQNAQSSRPSQQPRAPPAAQIVTFPVEYIPTYSIHQNASPATMTQFRVSATTTPTSQSQAGSSKSDSSRVKQYISQLARDEEERRQSYYDMLGLLDPYKGSPKEFIHLLVKAAMRDEEIAKAIRRLDEDRSRNPNLWKPVKPQDGSASSAQSDSQQSQQKSKQQNKQPSKPAHQQLHQQPQQQPHPQPHQQPRQQPHHQQPHQNPMPLFHTQQPFAPAVAPGFGPQQHPMPQTIVYYVYPPPHPGLPGPPYGQPVPNMYPQYGYALPPPPGIGVPPHPAGPFPMGAIPGQVEFPPPPHTPVAPSPSTPSHPPAQHPAQFINDDASRRRSSGTDDSTNLGGGATTDGIVNANSRADNNGTAVTNINDSAIELEDQYPEPKEQPCNFTWVVDRAETHLGWTGNWDKLSEMRQDGIGQTIAFKLQKLLKKMNAMVSRNVTFANRVHILTVMREVIMATLETDSRVGRACREHALEYDSLFIGAVEKLEPIQKQRLKVLEDGKWMEELGVLIDEAKRQSLFSRLEEAVALING